MKVKPETSSLGWVCLLFILAVSFVIFLRVYIDQINQISLW